MSYNGRAGESQDPLEKYRQALRRQQPTGFGSSEAAAPPPVPEEPPAAAEPLELDEPLVADDPLELDEPLPAEPLDLDQPLAAEDPLELDELLAEEAPPALEEPPAPDKSRSAADWLGLDEELPEEDPLGLDDLLAPEAAPQAASGDDQGGAEADDSLPDELQDTLERYQKAMSKLRASRGTEAEDPLAVPQADPGRPASRPEPEPGGGNDVLNKYLQAVDRNQSGQGGTGGTPATAARARSVSRETLNQFRKGRTERPIAPAADDLDADDLDADDLDADDLNADDLAADDLTADDLVRDFPTKVRVASKARRRARPAPQTASGWRTRAVTFTILLLAALPVQWVVYTRLGATFALEDLGAGLSALLPAALILLLARPVSGKGRLVMVVGSAAVALLGSAGFAYGLSLLQNQLLQGASLLFGLLLTLGLFTAVWGPLFLILVPVLSRMSLPARGRS